MKRVSLVLMAIVTAGTAYAEDHDAAWFDSKTTWNGYEQLHFEVADRSAYLVVPKRSAAGKPWVWRARFPNYHAQMDIALLARGYHVAYIDVTGMFGSPDAVRIGHEFYDYLTTKRSLSPRPCLEGVSRGGLFVYNWAAKNPDKVACIYCDTPVCDFKSWPGGKGRGLGSATDWQQCLKAYGLSEERALQSDQNPINHAEALAKAKVPILHVVAENDRVVPPEENTYRLKARLEQHGHRLGVISVPLGTVESNGHHFDHPEPDRIVSFIVRHTSNSIEPYFAPPESWRGKLGDYVSPLRFADGTEVKSVADWKRRRAEILAEWTSLLGEWPPLLTNPEVETVETRRVENFKQHRVRFRWTPRELTTGYLLVPDGETPRPAVITVYYEPETAIGLGKPNRDFAIQLARRGFVTLSIGTTEATAAKTYGLYHPNIENAEVQPLSMLAYAAANAWHVLAARPEVDPARIGIVGHSFGGKWAMFASCLFDKFACAAWSDPGIVFDESRPNVNYWEPWYLGYHPKPWRNRGPITADNPARGLYPRLTASRHDLHELHALMAPRPFLVSGGSEDPPRRWEALNHSVAVNNILGKSNRVAMTNRPDHAPNEDSNQVIYSFFERFLLPLGKQD